MILLCNIIVVLLFKFLVREFMHGIEGAIEMK